MFRRFLLCSGLAAVANLAVGYLLYAGLGLDGPVGYPVAVALAFVAGMGVSFALNRRYTFPPSGRRRRVELVDFTAVSLIGGALTTGLAELFRRVILPTLDLLAMTGLPLETRAHILAVALTAIYSFFAHKWISFRKPRPRAGALTPAGGQSR